VAQALSKNKSIYGFHFGGNYGYTDSKGFLIIEGEGKTAKNSYKETIDFRIRGV
jgi:hypothetical protein